MTQRPTIALLCARPPEQNTGMVTVDLAGKSFLSSHFPTADVQLFYYGSPALLPYPSGSLPFGYRDVWTDREAFLNADCRVVWGDFTHTAALWQPPVDAWPGQVPPQPADVAALSFLLGRDPAMLARTVSFGGTLITNKAEDLSDDLYHRALEGFYAGAHTTLLRDAISAAMIAEFRPEGRTLGIDCAFLNTPASIATLSDFAVQVPQDRIGVFFGRTPGLGDLLSFAHTLAKDADMPLHWLPWFHTRRRDRLLARLQRVSVPDVQPSPGTLLGELSGCRLVVTDTYHLAINAWRMGIPVICIGTGAGFALDSLSDKKKEILYKMYGADGLYVFAEAIRSKSGRQEVSRRAIARARDAAYVATIRERIAGHRRIAEETLAAAVADILGAGRAQEREGETR